MELKAPENLVQFIRGELKAKDFAVAGLVQAYNDSVVVMEALEQELDGIVPEGIDA